MTEYDEYSCDLKNEAECEEELEEKGVTLEEAEEEEFGGDE